MGLMNSFMKTLVLSTVGLVMSYTVATADGGISNPAIDISDGKYLAEQSSIQAVSGGNIGDNAASGINITADSERLNGLYVAGVNSRYTLSDAQIELSGNGANDFSGIGAAAMADKGATLILNNVKITTNGCVRSATTALDHSILKVYDSTLIANGGTLPSDYKPLIGPGMMEPPAGLGISGTARVCLTMGNSKSYYYNSTIIANGWGALSTDNSDGYVYLEANNCKIQTIKDGYGSYADWGCHDVFNKCQFNVAAMATIMAGESDVTFNDSDAVCGTYFVMLHSVMGKSSEKASLRVTGGNVVTNDAAFLVKSDNADIVIDGAKLEAKNGILLKSIINQDAFRTKVAPGEVVYGIRATLKDMTLAGNILHEDTERTMKVTLMNTTLTGQIKNASLYLDAESKWTATADSTIVLNTLKGSFNVNKIDALPGVTITAKAGADCALLGSYSLASGGVLVVCK
ncbi:MAG: hypothetical protein H6Q74_2717 [Firmicutes bacterium]|nr:hypothetical protein [Bacillota bacterium]